MPDRRNRARFRVPLLVMTESLHLMRLLRFTIAFGWLIAVRALLGETLPQDDMDFLRDMARDVIQASRVEPGSNGGGKWALRNTVGFALVTPGRDSYHSFWIRDFSMALDSGLFTPDEIREHLLLICRTQNGAKDHRLANGLHLRPWSIPDHINYDGRPTFYPGTYATGDDQGTGAFGRVPPIDDHYEFIHIAHTLWKSTSSTEIFAQTVNGVRVFDRLLSAFESPTTDPPSGLVQTSEDDRAVGYGFLDGVTQTGKLLFASLLRYRAAGELAELTAAVGQPGLAPAFRRIQEQIRTSLGPTFSDPKAIGGRLRASTGLSRQADVWGTLFALHLDVLSPSLTDAARTSIADAVRRGTIVCEGGVRQVPTDLDFSATTAWEQCRWPVNTYQNGGYWHTATGWLVAALWPGERQLARQVFDDMIAHLRSHDFRHGKGSGAPWEVFGPNGKSRQNPVYLTSVALPYGILKELK